MSITMVKPNSPELKAVLKTSLPSVYVVRCEQYYKIGHSYNVQNRLEGMRTGNPFEISVVYVIQTERNKELEIALHEYFADRKHYREWYKLEAQDEVYIEAFIDNFLHGPQTN